MTTRRMLPMLLAALVAFLCAGFGCDGDPAPVPADDDAPPVGTTTAGMEGTPTPDDDDVPEPSDTPETVAPPAPGSARIGEAAPNFQLTDATGATHRLSDHFGSLIVLEWTNYDCPVVGRHYRSGNMQGLQSRHRGDDVVWITICSSATGEQGHFTGDTLMRRIEGNAGDPSFYWIDTDGTVGHAYGATATPHMYVIDTTGTLRYQGAIDNDTRGRLPEGEVVNYVDAAIAAIRAGETIETTSTRSYGCNVKYEN